MQTSEYVWDIDWNPILKEEWKARQEATRKRILERWRKASK